MNIARGTRVELINLKNTQGYTDYSKSTSNTVGNVGNVTENDGDGHMWVDWNNGSSNSYREKNLRVLDDEGSTVNTQDE